MRSPILLLIAAAVPATFAFKSHDFKSCSQSAFCRRGRALADRANAARAAYTEAHPVLPPSPEDDKAEVVEDYDFTVAKAETGWNSPYYVVPDSVQISGATLKGLVKTEVQYDGVVPEYTLEIRVHHDGVVRVLMDDAKKEGALKAQGQRYNLTTSYILPSPPPALSQQATWWVTDADARNIYTIGAPGSQGSGMGSKGMEVHLEFSPLRIALKRTGREIVTIGAEGLLRLEHYRKKTETKTVEETSVVGDDETLSQAVLTPPVETNNTRTWFEGAEEDGYWEESFSSWTDSKPYGPESLSVDINFPSSSHLYGIPQHATSLSLPPTRGLFSNESFTDKPSPDPYRLYNLDVFEYEASSPFGLYGAIPLLQGHSEEGTVAVWNAIGSETWIDIEYSYSNSSDPSSKTGAKTHWISESGIVDLFLLPGPSPAEIFSQYSDLTGVTSIPPMWSIGYHQCRWNYVSSDDVRNVIATFDKEDIPVDVMWLDIEYSKDHMYMMWDSKTFPDPQKLIGDVVDAGRKLVVIVDPHLKRTGEYPAYEEAKKHEFLVKTKEGNEFEGWCWSGSSAWIDFFKPEVWPWWRSIYNVNPSPGKSDGKEGKRGLNGGWNWEASSDDVAIWNDMNEPSVFNGPEITMQKDLIHHGNWEHRDVHNINGMLYSNLTFQALLHRSQQVSPKSPKRPFVLTRAFFSGSQKFGAMWTGDNLGTWEHLRVGLSMVLNVGISGMPFAGSDVGGFFGNPEPEMLVRWYQLGVYNPFLRAHAHLDTKRREPYLLASPYKDIVKGTLRARYKLLPVWYTAFWEHEIYKRGHPVIRPQYVAFPKDVAGFGLDSQFWVGSSGILVAPAMSEGQREVNVWLAPEGAGQVYYTYNPASSTPERATVYRAEVEGSQVVLPAGLERTPLLIRGGSIIPTLERPRKSSKAMKEDPYTLRVALSQVGGSARGELYLDAGEGYAYRSGEYSHRGFVAYPTGGGTGLRVESRDYAAENARKEKTSYDANNAFVKAHKDVRVERIVVLGIQAKPTRVYVADTEKELAWEFSEGIGAKETDKQKAEASELVIKDPGVSVVGSWGVVVEF